MIGIEYAKSLIDIHPDIEKCMEEFKIFSSFYDTLSPVMKSPGISNNDKHNIIKESFKNYTDEFIYFIYVVIDNDRFDYVKEIYNEFEKLYNNKFDIASCEVYTSFKLNEKERKQIINFLDKKLGKKIVLKEIIDESINGIKIISNGSTIDYSLDSRINNIRFSL